MKVLTYLDKSFPTLSPATKEPLRLVFRAVIYKGPGFDEVLEWFYGPSLCGAWVVLWLKTDWDDESGKMPMACAPADMESISKPWKELLLAYWESEKRVNLWEDPNFSELEKDRSALMKPKEVQALADSIWPEP